MLVRAQLAARKRAAENVGVSAVVSSLICILIKFMVKILHQSKIDLRIAKQRNSSCWSKLQSKAVSN